MSDDANAAAVRRYWERCWNERRLDEVAGLFHDPYLHGRSESSPTGMVAVIEDTLGSFSDGRWEIRDLDVLQDAVITRSMFTGTHDGMAFGLPPTGRVITAPSLDVFFFRDGRIWRLWHLFDHLPMVVGMGAEVRVGDHIATWD